MMLEQFPLSSVIVYFNNKENWLTFEEAVLKVHKEWHVTSWFVDLTSVKNDSLLEEIRSSTNNKIKLSMETSEEHTLTGTGYFYPSVGDGNHASIRGDDELNGLNFLL